MTKVFEGFEEASKDNVNVLTKVVTSHILYIDVLGIVNYDIWIHCYHITLYLADFKPIKVLFPKMSTERTLSLTSEINHEQYPIHVAFKIQKDDVDEILLRSTSSIVNNTDRSLGLFVESDTTHWKLVNPSNQSENPFEHSVKVKEIPAHSSYSIPLVLTKESNFFIKPSNMK